MAEASCLFCRIASGDIPADIVRRTEHTVAFRDISPAAPTHVLVIPIAHHPDVAVLSAAEPELAALLLSEAALVARSEGVAYSGFRIVTNTGDDGGQTVAHVHLHVLGGRAMTWPPG